MIEAPVIEGKGKNKKININIVRFNLAILKTLESLSGRDMTIEHKHLHLSSNQTIETRGREVGDNAASLNATLAPATGATNTEVMEAASYLDKDFDAKMRKAMKAQVTLADEKDFKK